MGRHLEKERLAWGQVRFCTLIFISTQSSHCLLWELVKNTGSQDSSFISKTGDVEVTRTGTPSSTVHTGLSAVLAIPAPCNYRCLPFDSTHGTPAHALRPRSKIASSSLKPAAQPHAKPLTPSSVAPEHNMGHPSPLTLTSFCRV